MLPLGHLTPKTLIGAGGEQRETVGHLYASQIASTIATRNPEEARTLLVGFGLQKVDMERETFFRSSGIGPDGYLMPRNRLRGIL